jgi:phospholipid N-methyltransferase
LLDRIHPDAEILAIELERSYIEQLNSSGNEQLEVVEGSACELADHVTRKGWSQVDLVISSLPFVLPSEVKTKLFDYLLKCTMKGTTFRWFTYMPPIMKFHYKGFDSRCHAFVLRNFPPMWVYSVN